MASRKAQMGNLNIILYRGWKDTGKHVWSPFVIKVEARLRFAGVKYTTDAGSPRVAPKGKIPYMDIDNPLYDGDDASQPAGSSQKQRIQLCDSVLIARQLAEWSVLPDLNARLDPVSRAHDLALRALLEDKLYWYHGWERWVTNYYTVRDHLLWAIPYPVRIVIGMLAYRKQAATLHGQGTGRYDAEEIRDFRAEIWEAVDALLVASRGKRSGEGDDEEKKPFWVLGGEEPTEADGTVFGFIVTVLISAASHESQKVVKSFPVIMDYASRIHDTYFPDYEKWSA